MDKREQHKLDQEFRNTFENFEATPSKRLWENINQNLSSDELDETFRSYLKDQELSPNPKIWRSIKKQLPLSLLIKTHLNQLSKVAAVLVLAVLLTMYLQTNNNTIIADSQVIQKIEVAPLQLKEEIRAETIPENTIVEIIIPKYKKNQADNTAMLLASILSDDEKFNTKIDSDKIALALQPLKAPNMEFAEASLDNTYTNYAKYIDDLRISVPLVFAEANEVEALLLKYEKFKTEH